MEATKEWTNTDPKDAKVHALITWMYKLEKQKFPQIIQGGGGNITQTLTNTNNNGRDTNKSYFEGLNNIESWRVEKSRDKIARYVQDWYWYPKHNMEGKFDVIYMSHPSKNMMNRINKIRGR